MALKRKEVRKTSLVKSVRRKFEKLCREEEGLSGEYQPELENDDELDEEAGSLELGGLRMRDNERPAPDGRGALGRRGTMEDVRAAALERMAAVPRPLAQDDTTHAVHQLQLRVRDMEEEVELLRQRLQAAENETHRLKTRVQPLLSKAKQYSHKDISRDVRKWAREEMLGEKPRQKELFKKLLYTERLEGAADYTRWLTSIKNSGNKELHARLAAACGDDTRAQRAVIAGINSMFADGRLRLRDVLFSILASQYLGADRDTKFPSMDGHLVRLIYDHQEDDSIALTGEELDEDDEDPFEPAKRQLRAWKDLLERHEVPAPDCIDIRALAKHALTIFQPTKEANIATFHVAYVAFVYERWYHGQNLKMTSDQSPLETMQAVNTSWSGEAAEERINAIFAEHFDRLAYASEVV